MEIGHIIRRIRDQKGFSQKQIADELGMTQAKNNERVDVGTIIYEAETDIKQERLLWIQLLASKDEQIIQLKDANELLKTMLEHHR